MAKHDHTTQQLFSTPLSQMRLPVASTSRKFHHNKFDARRAQIKQDIYDVYCGTKLIIQVASSAMH